MVLVQEQGFAQAIKETFEGILVYLLSGTRQVVLEYGPELMLALLTLVSGWFLAVFLRKLTSKLFRALAGDVIAQRVGLSGYLAKRDIETPLSVILGWFVYVVVILTTIIFALERMQLEVPAQFLRDIVAWIPRLLVLLVLIGLAFVFGGWAERLTVRAARLASIPMYALVGAIVRLAIVLFAVVTALDYLEIASGPVLLGTLALFVVGLSVIMVFFSVCARNLTASLLGRNFISSEMAPGDWIEFDTIQGTIVEIRPTVIRVKTENGYCLIPIHLLQAQTVMVDRAKAVAKPAGVAKK